MNSAYLDSFGLPGTRQSDGTLDMGDSAAIYFNIIALSDENADKSSSYFSRHPLRHPDYTKWWGQPDRCSRDQMIPMLCHAIIKDHKDFFINDLWLAHAKKAFSLAWNTKANGEMNAKIKFPDFTGPEIWGLWLRIYKPFGYSLLLPFCDSETLINALLWKFYQPSSNRVTRNHMLIAIAQRQRPSFLSKLADKINNYSDLVSRWEAHCQAVGEYPTADLFKTVLKVGK